MRRQLKGRIRLISRNQSEHRYDHNIKKAKELYEGHGLTRTKWMVIDG